jgi:hypothetical protein
LTVIRTKKSARSPSALSSKQDEIRYFGTSIILDKATVDGQMVESRHPYHIIRYIDRDNRRPQIIGERCRFP